MRSRGLRSGAAVAAAVSAAVLLTGCGGGSPEQGSGEEPTAAGAAADGSEPSGADEPAAAAPSSDEPASDESRSDERSSDESASDPAAGSGDFCTTLEEFYELSVITLFGLAFEPTPEVVEATVQSAEVGAEVRELAPAEISGDLEPMIVLAEDLAAAMDGVDPADPAAVTAAAESVPAYLTQNEDMVAGVDAYTEDACSFTANSVAEEMMSGDAESTSTSSAAGGSDAEAGAADCEALDTDAIVATLGGEVVEVQQLGYNEDYTHQLGEQEFDGAATGCTVDLGLNGHGPPEVRISLLTMGAEFYPTFRGLAQDRDSFAAAMVADVDGFYYHETSFQAALVVNLPDGRTLLVRHSASASDPAVDQATMTAIGEAALTVIG